MTREEATKRLETIIENSKHNVKYDFGYIDSLTADYVAGKQDLTQNFDLSGARF